MTIVELLEAGIPPAEIPGIMNPTGDRDEANGIKIEIEIELGDIGDLRDPFLLDEKEPADPAFAGLTLVDFYPDILEAE